MEKNQILADLVTRFVDRLARQEGSAEIGVSELERRSRGRLHKSYWSELMAGKKTSPHPEKLQEIARVLLLDSGETDALFAAARRLRPEMSEELVKNPEVFVLLRKKR